MRSLFVVVLLAGCSTPMASIVVELDGGRADAGPTIADAQVTEEDAEALPRDAGARADAWVAPAVDAAGRDSGPRVDSGPPPECDVIAQDCRYVRDTCRLGRFDGIARCEPAGALLEGNVGRFESCFDDAYNDRCSHGLFCHNGIECVRYCSSARPECPELHSWPQACTGETGGVMYCEGV